MPFQSAGALRYFTFNTLSNLPVTHAVFTRHGGASEGPYAELNIGATVGDEQERVSENLERAFAAVSRPRASMFDSWLAHGTYALIAKAPRPPEWARPPKADIILTNKPEVTLFMRYADCVPILLFDPVKKAIGLAHAGWRGTVRKVVAKAIEAIQSEYGSNPVDLVVCIGPTICTEHYEVGGEVVEQVRAAFGEKAESLLQRHNGSTHFDLVGANRLTLQETGVRQIENADLCTASNTEDWFSHRASGGRTGRFGVLLALKSA